MLTAERISRNGSGGVLLKDLPLLTGHGPQLVMVQPRNLLEGCRENGKKKKNTKLRDVLGNRRALRERALQAVDISPDFSKFLDRPQAEERARGGSREREPMKVDVEDELLSGLANRKPSWNFESILKEIEEDSILVSCSNVNSSSSSTTTESADALPALPPDLIEIPLSQDDSEFENTESRRSTETQEALSRLFDQLLSDIYSHNLQPWQQVEGPERRSSDSRLPHFYRNHECGLLNRQMSFPGALSEPLGNRHRRSLPVRSLSGIDRLKSSTSSLSSKRK